MSRLTVQMLRPVGDLLACPARCYVGRSSRMGRISDPADHRWCCGIDWSRTGWCPWSIARRVVHKIPAIRKRKTHEYKVINNWIQMTSVCFNCATFLLLLLCVHAPSSAYCAHRIHWVLVSRPRSPPPSCSQRSHSQSCIRSAKKRWQLLAK